MVLKFCFFVGRENFFFLNGEKRGASKGGFFRIGQQHKQKSAYIFFFFSPDMAINRECESFGED